MVNSENFPTGHDSDLKHPKILSVFLKPVCINSSGEINSRFKTNPFGLSMKILWITNWGKDFIPG